MSWKKIAILALVLLGLIIAILLSNRKEIYIEETEGILLDFPAAGIEKIELQQKDMKFAFVKREALWYLEEPLAAKADKAALANIFADFCPLKYDRLVEENALDLKNYGLDHPGIELKLFAKGMAAPVHTILLGLKNNLDSSSYAKLAGGNKVVLIAAYKRSSLEKDLFAFREKKIAPFLALDVKELQFQSGSCGFSIKKNAANAWELRKPSLKNKLSEEKINRLLTALADCAAKEFVDNPQVAPEFVTMIKLQVEYFQNSGQLKNIELDFADVKTDTVSVRNPALPYWFKVDREILEELPKTNADISE